MYFYFAFALTQYTMSVRVHCLTIIILFVHFTLQNFRLHAYILVLWPCLPLNYLRTFPFKFSLARANWRRILSTMWVPCDLFMIQNYTETWSLYSLFNLGLSSSLRNSEVFRPISRLWSFLIAKPPTGNWQTVLTFLHCVIYQILYFPMVC